MIKLVEVVDFGKVVNFSLEDSQDGIAGRAEVRALSRWRGVVLGGRGGRGGADHCS